MVKFIKWWEIFCLDCHCSLDFIWEKSKSLPAMKRIIHSLAIITAFVALSSCEKHDWEDTKLLHVDKAEKHGSHAAADNDEAH